MNAEATLIPDQLTAVTAPVFQIGVRVMFDCAFCDGKELSPETDMTARCLTCRALYSVLGMDGASEIHLCCSELPEQKGLNLKEQTDGLD